jgi:hypothetical protein
VLALLRTHHDGFARRARGGDDDHAPLGRAAGTALAGRCAGYLDHAAPFLCWCGVWTPGVRTTNRPPRNLCGGRKGRKQAKGGGLAHSSGLIEDQRLTDRYRILRIIPAKFEQYSTLKNPREAPAFTSLTSVYEHVMHLLIALAAPAGTIKINCPENSSCRLYPEKHSIYPKIRFISQSLCDDICSLGAAQSPRTP